ncbi:AP-1 complex subunit sigma-2 isoform X3 [Perca fluviatilis]|uniref:AP-1 complex subunit sigma-2 isoform X3 n=2 Tax=Perca TaxID=8166 RepID=UPI001964010C|nr:AP-1 complex subunit sigma-2 isoform X3 [Perca fluviatilis]XP_039666850.1 AP-1 complex subunit sigma-2 isoform X3 [Perca fluviatilis]XP_039666851.1 AP-1 complex subunit sigma-2 isoform X3 [Perca fluviatilis]
MPTGRVCFRVALGSSFRQRGNTVLLFKMQFMLLFSRQGKLRLQKWYVPLSDKEKKKITRELVQTVLARKPKMCSFLEWRDLKVVYKRYASLYFCCAIEDQDNELITLEIIHRYVELLDKYFGSVCELDIIFNFEKAYFILDEFLLGGEAQETSKKNVLKAIEQADLLQENIDFQMRLFAGVMVPNMVSESSGLFQN